MYYIVSIFKPGGGSASLRIEKHETAHGMTTEFHRADTKWENHLHKKNFDSSGDAYKYAEMLIREFSPKDINGTPCDTSNLIGILQD